MGLRSAAILEARILAEDLRFSEITLTQLDDVLRSLASLPGRKLCLLVSDGFLVGTGTSDEQTRHLRAVIDAATRSGAVVYALDAHGLTTTGGDASAGRRRRPRAAPRRVGAGDARSDPRTPRAAAHPILLAAPGALTSRCSNLPLKVSNCHTSFPLSRTPCLCKCGDRVFPGLIQGLSGLTHRAV